MTAQLPGAEMIQRIAVNHRNHRLGQHHQSRPKLTDADVVEISDLHNREGWSYSRIAQHFGVSKSCVAMVVRCERRACIPARIIEVVTQ
jgi:hypothetical protein